MRARKCVYVRRNKWYVLWAVYVYNVLEVRTGINV